MARSLGQRPVAVWWRVVLPLVGPGLAAAFCLVFLSTVTELTLTLVMVPTGVQTLATQFWAYTTNISYGAAAPYAALMVAIAVVPSYILGRWFDRLPSRASGHVMTSLHVTDLHKSFGSHAVLDRHRPHGARRLVGRHPRTLGQREDHLAAGAGRVRTGRPGNDRPRATRWSTTVIGSCRRSGGASATSPKRVRSSPT